MKFGDLDEVADPTNDAEIQVLMRSRHPRLVWFMGTGVTTENEIFVLLEFMSLGSLDKHVWNAKKEMSWYQRLIYLRDIADAIEYLHLSRIIHRDLKTPNVLISTENNTRRAKVTDFGLSKILNRHEDGARAILRSHNNTEDEKHSKMIQKFTKSASSAFHSILQISKSFASKDLGEEKEDEDRPLLMQSPSIEQMSVVMTSFTGTAAYLSNEQAKHALDGTEHASFTPAIDAYVLLCVYIYTPKSSHDLNSTHYSNLILYRVGMQWVLCFGNSCILKLLGKSLSIQVKSWSV